MLDLDFVDSCPICNNKLNCTIKDKNYKYCMYDHNHDYTLEIKSSPLYEEINLDIRDKNVGYDQVHLNILYCRIGTNLLISLQQYTGANFLDKLVLINNTFADFSLEQRQYYIDFITIDFNKIKKLLMIKNEFYL